MLGLWESRDKVTIGILSLSVRSPKECETLETLRRWSLPPSIPWSATSRRQLTTIVLKLRLVPRCWYSVWTRVIAMVGALLTHNGVLTNMSIVEERPPYLRLAPTWFAPSCRFLTSVAESKRCRISLLCFTLREKNVIAPCVEERSTPPVTPRMTVAPFTDGCVVMTTRPFPRNLPANVLNPVNFAVSFATSLRPRHPSATLLKARRIVLFIGAKFPIPRLSVIRRTVCLVLLITLLIAPLLAHVVLVTLFVALTRWWSPVPFDMTLIRCLTFPAATMRLGSLPIHTTLFILLRCFTWCSLLAIARTLVSPFVWDKPRIVRQTTVLRLWQKLLGRSTPLVILTVLPLRSTVLRIVTLVLTPRGGTCFNTSALALPPRPFWPPFLCLAVVTTPLRHPISTPLNILLTACIVVILTLKRALLTLLPPLAGTTSFPTFVRRVLNVPLQMLFIGPTLLDKETLFAIV